MSTVEMRDRVAMIIADQLGIDVADISPDASVVEDLGADSLDVVELIITLEGEFDIEIPNREAERITKVQNIFDYMGEALQAA